MSIKVTNKNVDTNRLENKLIIRQKLIFTKKSNAVIFKRRKINRKKKKSLRKKKSFSKSSIKRRSEKSLIYHELISSKTNLSKQISIKIKQNNVFCTLTDIKKNQILYVTSAGKSKIKTSKKVLRYSSKSIIESFFKSIKKYCKERLLVINLIGPIKIRKSIIKQISKNTLWKVIINVKEKKCFNGCRAKKKRRKKRQRFIIFK
jgi:ribosomal protein S11